MSLKNKIAARVLCCILAGNLILPLLAVSADGAVSISTVEDFKNFTEKCVYDEYSVNKQFVLQNDIDLKGVTIKGAGVFCGTFEGNGHSIKNLTIDDKGSNKGLFAVVKKDAKIKDLNITGEISISEDASEKSDIKDKADRIFSKLTGDEDSDEITSAKTKNAGAIAGYNEGIIVNCSFDGKLKGEGHVGGIAGANAMTGIIDTCQNGGEISGDSEVGGIAGYNEGRVKLSKNTGKICPNADENTVNVGGITGESKGAVVICQNSGTVGGKSFGDNVGGVCGRQSGEIRECINDGSVTGRRSVGGICGRFEPYTDIELSYESAKAALDKQIDTYQKDVEKARDRLVDLFDELTDGKGLIDAVLDHMGINRTEANNRLNRVTDSSTKMMDSVTNAINRAENQNLSGNVNDTLNSARDALDSLGSLSEDAKNQLRDTADSLDTTLNSLNNTLHEFDGKGAEITDTLNNLNDALNNGQDDVDEIKDRLFTDLDSINDDLDHLSDNLDSTHSELKATMRNLQSTGSTITDAFDDIDDAVENVKDDVDGTKKNIRDLKKSIENRIKEIKNNIKISPLPTLPPVNIPSIAPQSESGYNVEEGSSLDEVYEVEPSVIGMIREAVIPTVYAAKKEEDDDDFSILKDIKSTDIVMPRLIGNENADTALVRYCVNNGAVSGNEFCGGVSGSMGFESAIRNGESITLAGGIIVDADAMLKALVDACISYGKVTSKKNYAGGCVGKCDIGDIRNTLTTGEIKCEEGQYAGGIAGLCGGNIENCIAINDVDAESYLGGIAGSGNSISTSYSMARLDGTKENSGAIAGFLKGDAFGTYFIDEGLSGISGANLQGIAEAVAPKDMAASDGTIPKSMGLLRDADFYMATGDLFMPQIKKLAQNDAESIGATLQSKSTEMARFHFNVLFKDKGNELKSMTVDYGTVLSDRDIPTLTADGNDVPKWDKNTKEPIVRHTTFTAVYNEATMTLSSGEEPPILLVESIFDEGCQVNLKFEDTAHNFNGYKVNGVYSFSITKNAYDKIKVHIRDEKKKAAKIAVNDKGKWLLIDCEIDGNYAVFEVGTPCTFAVLYKETSPLAAVIIIIGAALIMTAAGLGAYILIRRRKDGKTEKKSL